MGAEGPKGTFDATAVETVVGPKATLNEDNRVDDSTAECPSGTKLLGGGWITDSADILYSTQVVNNGPIINGANSWTVLMAAENTQFNQAFTAYATCGKPSASATQRSASRSKSVDIDAAVASAKERLRAVSAAR